MEEEILREVFTDSYINRVIESLNVDELAYGSYTVVDTRITTTLVRDLSDRYPLATSGLVVLEIFHPGVQRYSAGAVIALTDLILKPALGNIRSFRIRRGDVVIGGATLEAAGPKAIALNVY